MLRNRHPQGYEQKQLLDEQKVKTLTNQVAAIPDQWMYNHQLFSSTSCQAASSVHWSHHHSSMKQGSTCVGVHRTAEVGRAAGVRRAAGVGRADSQEHNMAVHSLPDCHTGYNWKRLK